MRTQSIVGILLGTLATAALAQVAAAPIEQKDRGNVQVDEAAPASNVARTGNVMPPGNASAPKDEAVPADPPPNAAAPVEPKPR